MFRTSTLLFHKPLSPFYMEVVEFFGGGTIHDLDIFDMYYGITPGMGQANKIGKGSRRTLGHHLHTAVRKVPDVPMHSCRLGTIRDEMPVSYSLNTAFSQGGYPFHSIFPDPVCFID
jgi:hypothetical protein